MRGCSAFEGAQRGHHPYTLEQLRPVDLPVVDERVAVAVGRDDARPLPHSLADLGPGDALLVQE